MKKSIMIIIISLLVIFSFSVYSEDKVMNLYINQIPIELNNPVLLINNDIMVPLNETFKTFGAQVFMNETFNSYYLNTYVKVNVENQYYSINGKKYHNNNFVQRDDEIYAPIEILYLAFDFTETSIENNDIHLKANSTIQYTNYNSIPYRSIAFEKEGARFSVPLDWDRLNEYTYGYNSAYGRVSANFSTRMLNDNIDLDLIMDTYSEHLTMEYKDRIKFSRSDQRIYNYLTSNVLYFETDVNDILSNHVVHFVPTDDRIYIMAFRYPDEINKSYILEVIENIMDTFYIDESSFNADLEHYLEFKAARDYHLRISSKAYANMTVNSSFPIEGYFNTDEIINSLMITVSRNEEKLEFVIPVENNSFMADIYVPFGLGKHDIKIAITPEEEKITFDSFLPNQPLEEKTLLRFSVVNLSSTNNRYLIPTKMVQSDHNMIKSMSNLLTYKYHTDYSKATQIYKFIVEDIDVLEINEVNYSALNVYEEYKGTKKEILMYMTALLRAQNIQSKIVEGKNSYVTHRWTEAYLNGEWIIIDPFGDDFAMDEDETNFSILEAGFNQQKSLYKSRYPSIKVLEH